MKTVMIISPYKGYFKTSFLPKFIIRLVNFFIVKRNINYAKKCVIDSFLRNEIPFCGHLLYTRMLNDRIQEDRNKGIQAGIEWGMKADIIAVYKDYGISEGMKSEIDIAELKGKNIVYRNILK